MTATSIYIEPPANRFPKGIPIANNPAQGCANDKVDASDLKATSETRIVPDMDKIDAFMI